MLGEPRWRRGGKENWSKEGAIHPREEPESKNEDQIKISPIAWEIGDVRGKRRAGRNPESKPLSLQGNHCTHMGGWTPKRTRFDGSRRCRSWVAAWIKAAGIRGSGPSLSLTHPTRTNSIGPFVAGNSPSRIIRRASDSTLPPNPDAPQHASHLAGPLRQVQKRD